MTKDSLNDFQEIISVKFKNLELLKRALTHKSYDSKIIMKN